MLTLTYFSLKIRTIKRVFSVIKSACGNVDGLNKSKRLGNKVSTTIKRNELQSLNSDLAILHIFSILNYTFGTRKGSGFNINKMLYRPI